MFFSYLGFESYSNVMQLTTEGNADPCFVPVVVLPGKSPDHIIRLITSAPIPRYLPPYRRILPSFGYDSFKIRVR